MTATVNPTPTGRSRLSAALLPEGQSAGRAHVVLLRNMKAYRNAWMVIFSGFFEPVFYLLAIGIGLGSVIGDVTAADTRQVSYAEFVAPGLLAASAMNGAIMDSTYNVYFKLRLGHYDGLLATPLGPVDIALGEIGWALLRGGIYATGFLGVISAFGLVSSPWALLAVPAAVLSAFAFAAVGMAATSFMRSWEDFDLVPLVQMPMFFLATTFYPLSVYPEPLQVVIKCLPLYQSVQLIRDLTTSGAGWGLLWHVFYFVVMAAMGCIVTVHRIRKLLLK